MITVISNASGAHLFTGEWSEVLDFLRERGFVIIGGWLDWVVVE
jgi:hypothetical protein